ncbi:MAG: CotH kinase family protein [Lachnospiraceae bacterium]|nr:CotH kinase family protein [Lachnospiraceae bacterium]
MRDTKKYLVKGAAAALTAIMTLSLAGGFLPAAEKNGNAQAAELTAEIAPAPAPEAPKADAAGNVIAQAAAKDKDDKEEKFVPSDVEGPVFSAEGGFYTAGFNVTLTLPDSLKGTGAKIYYTLDGSEPDPGSAISRSEITPTPSPTPTPKPANPWGNWGDWGGGSNDKRGVNPKIPTGTFVYDDENGFAVETKPKSGTYLAGTVVRAIVVDKNGKSSDIETVSYFVGSNAPTKYTLPVVSLVTDPDSLHDPKTGLFTNYDESGREWERPGVFQYYVDGQEELDMNIGIRLHGAYSRRNDFKSFRLYAREEYDTEKWFKYNFFENSVIPANESNSSGDSIEKFKHLILRAGGNEAQTGDSTMMRDAFVQSLMTNTKLDLQAYQPVVVYLNGDYYGMMNVRERFDSHYFATHYNTKKENIAVYNFWYDEKNGDRNIEVDDGTDEDKKYLEDFYQYVEDHDLSQEENYQWVAERLDIENYIDYLSVQLFCNNHDWPGNNCRAWRYTGEPMDAYGLDGKIRFCLFDTEYSLNLYNQQETQPSFDSLAAATAKNSKEWPNQHGSTLLLRKLLENDGFREQFATRYMDLLNTNFSSRVTVKQFNEMFKVIESAFKESGTKNSLGNGVDSAKKFLSSRNSYAFGEISKHLSAGPKYRLELYTNTEGFGSYNINTIEGLTADAPTADEDRWAGYYCANIPVKVTAVAAEGYHFSHWEEFPEVTDATYIIDSSRGDAENVKLTPVFEEGPAETETEVQPTEEETQENESSGHDEKDDEDNTDKKVYRILLVSLLLIVLVVAVGVAAVSVTRKMKS